jgi:lipoprotein-releasing system permease protein
MNFPLFIARRYLIAKKSHNAINIISIISVIGVGIGTMALIVILSVFNGFDKLVQSLYNSFYPDLKITAMEGKVFPIDSVQAEKLQEIKGVRYVSHVVEENALLRYGERQHIATIKGVDENYKKVTGLDTMIMDGDFILREDKRDFAVVGQGVSYYLAIGLNFINPIVIYVPKRTGRVTLNPAQAFNKDYIFPSGIFSIEQEIETKYVIVPIGFARDLFDYKHQVSSLELSLEEEANEEEIKQAIVNILGDGFDLKNRYEQNEMFYKIMKSEKWAIFFILTFILIVASFNIVGSLTMLILDKKRDIHTFLSLGLSMQKLRKIFMLEGFLITSAGTISGLVIGFLVAWVQQTFGIIKLQGSGSFVIDEYPVVIEFSDFVAVLLIVTAIGFFTAWYPTRFVTRKYFSEMRKRNI